MIGGSQLKIFIKEIEEGWSQKNFRTLKDFLQALNNERVGQAELRGFQHLDLSFPAAAANIKVPHNIGEIPLDVVQTFFTGTGALTWNYATFTKDTLDITVTGPCRVRAYVGIHKDGIPI